MYRTEDFPSLDAANPRGSSTITPASLSSSHFRPTGVLRRGTDEVSRSSSGVVGGTTSGSLVQSELGNSFSDAGFVGNGSFDRSRFSDNPGSLSSKFSSASGASMVPSNLSSQSSLNFPSASHSSKFQSSGSVSASSAVVGSAPMSLAASSSAHMPTPTVNSAVGNIGSGSISLKSSAPGNIGSGSPSVSGGALSSSITPSPIQSSSASVNTASSGVSIESPEFGLKGLLRIIRMTDPDLNTLALGTDLTSLGLDLNSTE